MKGAYLWIAICLVARLSAMAQQRDWNSVSSWVYQLCNYRDDRLDEIAGSDFDLAVIDLARDGGTNYFTREEVGAVKNTGKFVLAYFSIGSIEEYRPEWRSVPAELRAGRVSGWPQEHYVKFWDERWWPVVRGRLDRAFSAGFDGAYLDMLTTYAEIPNSGLGMEERAKRMVALVIRISEYAKNKQPDFKIVPQNCPELYTWSHWEPKPNEAYLHAIDGLGLESVFFLAHDKPATMSWCLENRKDAQAIRQAGKLVLGVDYARKPESAIQAHRMQKALGFVPYVTVRELDRVQKQPASDEKKLRR